MSTCKIESGQKRKHEYPEGSKNKCSRCGHETKHGTNYRKAVAKQK